MLWRLKRCPICLSSELNSYVVKVDDQVENMFFHLVKQLVELERITEQLH